MIYAATKSGGVTDSSCVVLGDDRGPLVFGTQRGDRGPVDVGGARKEDEAPALCVTESVESRTPRSCSGRGSPIR